MRRLKVNIAVSLDGFVAGPHQSEQDRWGSEGCSFTSLITFGEPAPCSSFSVRARRNSEQAA